MPGRAEVRAHALGDVVAAVLSSDATHEELVRFCARELPSYAVLRFVRFVDALPKTASARVEKYKVRAGGVTEDTWDREEHGITLAR